MANITTLLTDVRIHCGEARRSCDATIKAYAGDDLVAAIAAADEVICDTQRALQYAEQARELLVRLAKTRQMERAVKEAGQA